MEQNNTTATCVDGCLQDNFTDIDGTLLENHVPDGGNTPFNWVRIGPQAAEIRNNAVSLEGLGGTRQWYYLTSHDAGDWAELQVEVFDNVASYATNHDVSILLRTTNGNDGYLIDWTMCGGSGFCGGGYPEGQIATVIDRQGAPSTQVQFSTSPVSPGLHTFRAELVGTQVVVTIDGAVVLSAAVSAGAPPGRAGISFTVANPNGVEPTSVRITAFTAALPPCPPTDDAVLDDPDVKKDLELELVASRGSGGPLSKQEHTGWIYQWEETQDYFVHPEQDPGATDCGNTIRAPQGVPGAVPVRPYHTHPSYNGELLFGCGGEPQVADRSPKWGGGSTKDWKAAENGSMYVVTYDKMGQPGKVYRLDPSIASSPSQWGTNPNKWQFDSKRCLQKLP